MKIESQSIFSIRLKELRISKGFTQSELGKKVGVSQNTFTNWENGSREPNFKTLRKLANVLETTIDYLLGEEEMTVQLVFASRLGSLSTVVGDEKLCARENDFRSLSLYVQSDENLGSKVLEVTKSKRLSFDVFNKLVSGFQFGIGIRLLQSVGNISFVL